MDGADEVVTEALAQVLRRHQDCREGLVADYIPELAGADPEDFALALVSMEGHRYAVGRATRKFTLQSVSKPFVFALAVAELGLDEVLRFVGAEPSGEAFNAISLEAGTGRPANPMINAGAIAVTALVPAADEERRFARVLRGLERFAGTRLRVDERVYRSEAATGDVNRALAHLMRGAGSGRTDPVAAVDTYFRQCAVLVDTVDVAVMAATLANAGVNPVTGESVVPEVVARRTLAVMASCGMYDGAGEWMLRVGLPAKSGVSGGLAAAAPARFGMAAYSPRLDARGNPVRGVAALRELSERFGLHLLHHPPAVSAAVTARGLAPDADRSRDAGERRLLDRHRARLGLVAAEGFLDFTAAERLVHVLRGPWPAGGTWLTLDLERVVGADPAAAALLDRALERLVDGGHRVAVVHGRWQPGLPGRARVFTELREALAAGEDALLDELADRPGR